MEEKPVSTKKKKIRNMSLKEVEEKLKLVESTMGGHSKYAQHLLMRKEELTKK